MSELTNKISYLKGLTDGMKIAEKSDEGTLIAQLIDALSDTVKEIERISSHCDTLDEAVDRLRDETDDINMSIDELFAYNDAEDDLSFADYDDDDEDDELFDSYDEDEDDELFEIQCPKCKEDVIVDYDMIDDGNSIVCPNCHSDIELEFDVDDEDDEDQQD